MTRIAIEATGCDKGFSEVLKGARKALEKDSSLELILVAGKDKIQERPGDIEVAEAEHTYNPGKENRQRESSIYKAIEMHKKREVDAVIAPGDTGATVLYSTGLLKRMKGILKPAIPSMLPFTNVLVDVGANLKCNSQELFQFAVVGKVVSQACLGVENPLVGLMNIGEEVHKGLDEVQKARELFKELEKKGYNVSDKYFEPNAFGFEYLDAGRLGISDGWVGNFILKAFETALRTEYKVLEKEIKKQNLLRQGCAWYGTHKPIEEIKKKFDYRNYATCPLLGVKGNVMVCHGESDAEAISNAIEVTSRYLGLNVNEKLEEEISKF